MSELPNLLTEEQVRELYSYLFSPEPPPELVEKTEIREAFDLAGEPITKESMVKRWAEMSVLGRHGYYDFIMRPDNEAGIPAEEYAKFLPEKLLLHRAHRAQLQAVLMKNRLTEWGIGRETSSVIVNEDLIIPQDVADKVASHLVMPGGFKRGEFVTMVGGVGGPPKTMFGHSIGAGGGGGNPGQGAVSSEGTVAVGHGTGPVVVNGMQLAGGGAGEGPLGYGAGLGVFSAAGGAGDSFRGPFTVTDKLLEELIRSKANEGEQSKKKLLDTLIAVLGFADIMAAIKNAQANLNLTTGDVNFDTPPEGTVLLGTTVQDDSDFAHIQEAEGEDMDIKAEIERWLDEGSYDRAVTVCHWKNGILAKKTTLTEEGNAITVLYAPTDKSATPEP